MVDMTLIRPLKMIGKGFVLFQINNSPSAFYTIKAICIIVIGFKVAIIFKKLSKMQTRTFVYVLVRVPSDDVIA